MCAAPQTAAPELRPALSGAWTLIDANAGGGKVVDQVEVVPGGGSPGSGTGATDGAGSGVTGGRGGFVPGASDPGLGHLPVGWSGAGNKLPEIKPKRLSASEALRKELLTPPEELTISLTKDAVVIGDGIGAAVSYKMDGKSESHQLVNGSVKTKTHWIGSALRQDIDAGRNADLGRIFELLENGQLRVTFGPASSLSDWTIGARPRGTQSAPTVDARRALYARK